MNNKITSIRIDGMLVGSLQETLSNYNIKSIGDLVNSIAYLARYGADPLPHKQVRRLLDDILQGLTKTNNETALRRNGYSQTAKELFFDILSEYAKNDHDFALSFYRNRNHIDYIISQRNALLLNINRRLINECGYPLDQEEMFSVIEIFSNSEIAFKYAKLADTVEFFQTLKERNSKSGFYEPEELAEANLDLDKQCTNAVSKLNSMLSDPEPAPEEVKS